MIDKESDKIYVMIKQVKYIQKLGKREFLEASYDRNSYKSIAIKNVNAEYYPEISVSEIPFKEKKIGECFLISPITENLYKEFEKIRELRGTGEYTELLLFEEFYDIVLNTKEYGAIIDWVYLHQYHAQKCTRTEIKNIYKQYIEEIHEFYIRNEKSDL